MKLRKQYPFLLISLNSISVTLVSGFTKIVANNLSHRLYNVFDNELHAKPKRLEDNAEGVLYVNDKVRMLQSKSQFQLALVAQKVPFLTFKKCINCAACSYFAPTTFDRSSVTSHHIVSKQPALDSSDLLQARAALAACPVSAIRTLTSAELSHRTRGKERLSSEQEELAKHLAINTKTNGLPLPFPKPLIPLESKVTEEEMRHHLGVWLVGHHSEKTFGAMPYFLKGQNSDGRLVSVMVDVPKCSPSAIRAIQSLLPIDSNGPDYLFMTHVDDTAGHGDWKKVFPNLKRIMHNGDLGKHNWVGDETLNDIEVLLNGKSETNKRKLAGWTLDGVPIQICCQDEDDVHIPDVGGHFGDFLILHTPGHSPGSASLLHRNAAMEKTILFTGDTFAYTTRDGGHMSGFPAYGNDLSCQVESLRCLLNLRSQWDFIACGHGHPRSYSCGELGDNQKILDVEDAVKELEEYQT